MVGRQRQRSSRSLVGHLADDARRDAHHDLRAAPTSRVTSAPAATNASSPISTPGTSTTPPPTRQARRNTAPAQRLAAARGGPSCRRSCVSTPGPEEDVVLDHRPAGDVHAGLDQHARADRGRRSRRTDPRPTTARAPIVERSRTCAWSPMIAPSTRSASRRRRPRRSRRSRRASSTSGASSLARRGARPGPQPRPLAEHDEVLDGAVLTELDAAVDDRPRADPRPGSDPRSVVDDRARGDLDAGAELRTVGHRRGRRAPGCPSIDERADASSERWSCSSTRTTRKPALAVGARAPAARGCTRRSARTPAAAARRSGSAGEKMSPLRVMYSP